MNAVLAEQRPKGKRPKILNVLLMTVSDPGILAWKPLDIDVSWPSMTLEATQFKCFMALNKPGSHKIPVHHSI